MRDSWYQRWHQSQHWHILANATADRKANPGIHHRQLALPRLQDLFADLSFGYDELADEDIQVRDVISSSVDPVPAEDYPDYAKRP